LPEARPAARRERRRRGRRLAGLLLRGLLLLIPPLLAFAPRPAAAQAILRDEGDYRSPQHFALELRLGPYTPDVDGEFAGTGRAPHAEYFGKKPRLLGQIELDYQFFHLFGSAAVGVSIGYFNESARAFAEPAPGQPAAERAGDETELTLVPVALSLVYRFDVAARRWNVPLIPYGKAGLNYTLWSIYDGNDNIARSVSGPGRGRGGTAGWHVAAGVSFLLDVIDPGAARELDAEIGVNHTHVFVELTRIEASGLGQARKLHVGDTTWFAGLLFEM
jgi:hypothetical protein